MQVPHPAHTYVHIDILRSVFDVGMEELHSVLSPTGLCLTLYPSGLVYVR